MDGSDARQPLSPWRSWSLGGFLEDPEPLVQPLRELVSRVLEVAAYPVASASARDRIGRFGILW